MFKHTGIVRRIDEAGRISIPKEIRKKYRLSDGEPVEIGEGENVIMLKKYSVLELINETTRKLLTSFYRTMDMPIILCSTTNILYSAGITLGSSTSEISSELSDYLKGDENSYESIFIDYVTKTKILAIEKIIINGYAEGALILPFCGREASYIHLSGLRFCADALASIAE